MSKVNHTSLNWIDARQKLKQFKAWALSWIIDWKVIRILEMPEMMNISVIIANINYILGLKNNRRFPMREESKHHQTRWASKLELLEERFQKSGDIMLAEEMIHLDKEIKELEESGKPIEWLLLLKVELQEKIEKIYPAKYDWTEKIENMHYSHKWSKNERTLFWRNEWWLEYGYIDRIWEWDREKAKSDWKKACEEYPWITAQTYQEFLRIFYDDENIGLRWIMDQVASNWYNYGVVWYKRNPTK